MSVNPAKSTTGLAWKKRATVVLGATHRRRTWESWCGWYRIVHSRCLYGPRKGKQAIADVWYATKLVVESGGPCWEVIGKHRKRGPAERACEKDARRGRDEGQFCSRCGEHPPEHFGVPTLFDGAGHLCDRCWRLFHGGRRALRMSATRQPVLAEEKCSALPGQLSFSFVFGSVDT